MGIEEIKNTLEKQIMLLNDQEKKLDILNNSFKEYYSKDIQNIVERCEYRIGNLNNAHVYSKVAIQIEVQKDTDELSRAVDSLNSEMNDLEVIKKDLEQPLGIDIYDELASNLVTIIDADLKLGKATLDRADAAMNAEFDSLNVHEPITEKVEKVEEAPAEVVTDSLDELAKGLEEELGSISDVKEDLEETSKSLEENEVSETNNYENDEEPILEPEEKVDLESFISNDDFKPEEKIESADNVEDGFVHVDDVEDFNKENDEERVIEDSSSKGKGRRRAA